MSQKRSIFEEVGSDKTPERPKPQTGLIDRARTGARGAIRVWLIVLFALVMVMIVVGGLTRLTDSGLSITEWKPVTGALPPMTAEAWDTEFAKYQAIPEYQLQNKGMTLAEFKSIYWWEWGHRQLGRVIGLVWAAGFAFFLATRRIPTGWTPRLLGIGLLGGLQGAIGWWMVSSGLSGDRLDVASYRLATHLGLAFIILGLIAWYALLLGRKETDLMQARRTREPKLFSMTTGLMHFAFLQILLGALVAGIDAGRGFTDWPLMAGRFFPENAFSLSPLWRNFFEDDGLVQFMHRMSGYLLFAFGLIVWRASRRSGNTRTKRAYGWMAVMLFGQIVLGIVTVMYSAPPALAIVHQIGAVLLWVLILRARYLAQYPIPQSVRGTRA
ncbi:MAG: heme A synthase [Paracoccaceae bacterium]